MKNVNGLLPIALVVGDVRGYYVLSNHCHIQILDVSHDLLNGFVSGLPFSSPPSPSLISNLLFPSSLGRPDTQASLPFVRTSRPTRFLLACSRRSDNGVRREGREREKNKEEKKEGVPSLSPLPLVVFFSAQISLHCPHDLHVWNRLGSCA